MPAEVTDSGDTTAKILWDSYRLWVERTSDPVALAGAVAAVSGMTPAEQRNASKLALEASWEAVAGGRGDSG